MMILRRINPINILMLLYIISLYLFTYREGYTFVSNIIALALMGAIWINFLVMRQKLVFNKTVFAFLLFIVVCIISSFVAIDQDLVFSKVVTLGSIFLLMISLVNYIDSMEKLKKSINYFIYAGFIASLYIILSTDFSEITRIGAMLGNVNSIGIIIGISATFSFYLLITKYQIRQLLFLVVMLPIIVVTGSRKSLFFIIINFIVILFLNNSRSIKKIIKFVIISLLMLLIMFYLIYHVEFFYLILGTRMENFFAFITGNGTNEASLNMRSYMAKFGFSVFKYKPWLGYGIDNYRILLGRETGNVTYAHNNFIELMVGTGLLGLIVYYLTHYYVLKSLYKMYQRYRKLTIYYPFIAIVFSYTILSISMVYYDDKHISIILAIGSVIGRILPTYIEGVSNQKPNTKKD